MAKQTHLLARIHRNIGGVWGWFALILGFGMLGAGIFVALNGTGALSATIPQYFGVKIPPSLLMTGITVSTLGVLIVMLVVTIPIVRYYQEKSAETQANNTIAEFDRKVASGEYKNPPPNPLPRRPLFGGVKTFPPLAPRNDKDKRQHNTTHIWSSDEEVKDDHVQRTVQLNQADTNEFKLS